MIDDIFAWLLVRSASAVDPLDGLCLFETSSSREKRAITVLWL
jgi:hypothetical protein